jgi:hypothetical protein
LQGDADADAQVQLFFTKNFKRIKPNRTVAKWQAAEGNI